MFCIQNAKRLKGDIIFGTYRHAVRIILLDCHSLFVLYIVCEISDTETAGANYFACYITAVKQDAACINRAYGKL